MTRERWIIGGIGALVVVLLATGTVLALSGDDGGSNVAIDPATTTSSSSTTTTLAPVTSTSGGTTTVTIGAVCTTPEEASIALVDAWLDGDQAAAARCAVEAAVTTIFQTSGAGAQYTWQGCFGDPGMPTCSYTYEGGAMNLSLAGTEANGWKVQSVGYVAD